MYNKVYQFPIELKQINTIIYILTRKKNLPPKIAALVLLASPLFFSSICFLLLFKHNKKRF